ncbi:MAG TPA: transposase, partial [Pyrinomonadaceae bacterium]|nr:transposase [Pyrinomonadaceae bacterium]
GNDAHWRALPERFPPHQTCRRRFRQWLIDGTLRAVLEALEQDLRERGGFGRCRMYARRRARV